jgi:uncharacterized membrane protein
MDKLAIAYAFPASMPHCDFEKKRRIRLPQIRLSASATRHFLMFEGQVQVVLIIMIKPKTQ